MHTWIDNRIHTVGIQIHQQLTHSEILLCSSHLRQQNGGGKHTDRKHNNYRRTGHHYCCFFFFSGFVFVFFRLWHLHYTLHFTNNFFSFASIYFSSSICIFLCVCIRNSRVFMYINCRWIALRIRTELCVRECVCLCICACMYYICIYVYLSRARN